MRAFLLALTATLALFGRAAFAQGPESTFDASALLTLIVALIAVTLVALAIGVWRLAERVARCCAKSDQAIRSYLFPVRPALYKEGGGGAYVLTRLGNFGRTPGILTESYLEAVASEPAGSQSLYQKGRLLKHYLVLDVNAQDVTLDAPAFPIDDATGCYLIGYFRYLDVLGTSHMTRYCYRVEPATASFERAGSAAWNAFD